MKKRPPIPLIPVLLLAFTGTALYAQTPLVNWDHTWDYMQPMGVLPDRPAGGADSDFETTWFLNTADFTTQYDGPTFGGTKTAGVPGTTNSYDHGSGPGPLGFDAMDYWTTAGALFTKNGTTLTVPASGSRYTAYFRTTFTVPNDGNVYAQPVINYLMDDGGFIYLDGELVMAVNMAAGASDTYTGFAANSTNNENQIRVGDLSLPAGTATGAGLAGAGTNATIVKRLSALTPGVHTLAVSLHQVNVTGTDIGLSLQLTAGPVTPGITGVKVNSSRRNTNGTPTTADDTVDFSITVNGFGGDAGWKITGPAGSSLLGETGDYRVAKTFTGVPFSEFGNSGLVLTVQDATNAALSGTVTVTAPLPVLDWNHTWDYMQPMGVLPERFAGGPDTDFDTTWYLKRLDYFAQYDGPAFGGTLTTGNPALTTSYDHGSGPGPLGFDNTDYWGTPGALFSSNGTTLTVPASGSRYTSYYRTTFTVPNDGNLYGMPELTYLMDDGGFIYLDGVLVLRVNMAAGVADTYTQLAANATDNENLLRTADLSLAAGAATGTLSSTGATNATVVVPVGGLAPGEHTLAVSLHQSANTSSDAELALQLAVRTVTPSLSGIKLNEVRRNTNGTPALLEDDTVDFSITVNGVGSPAGWVISGPEGSSLVGQTGTYGVARAFTAVPISDFPSSILVLTARDADAAAVSGTVTVPAPLPVLDWSHTWEYMQPMGVLPDSPAGGADTDFETTWYLKASDFTAQYNGPEFGGTLTAGDPLVTNSYNHGSGAGPLGFDNTDYWATAGALFTANGTTLTVPASGNRRTAYFRTTFTIPNDGLTYTMPAIHYIMDDGGFVYLDGVPVLNVNMTAGSTDAYAQFALNATDNENQIRVANLTLPAGSATGGLVTTGVTNATVLQPVTTLAPGTHTLAISLHQVNATSTDAELAIQVTTLPGTGGVIPGDSDTDGDGVSDADELVMGTDANNASDVLRLAQAAGNPGQITFTSKAGKYYRVYSSTDLGTWSDAGLTTIAGDNSAKQFNIPTPVPGQRRYFRLHVMGADGVWPANYP